jgi:hypothetical protein
MLDLVVDAVRPTILGIKYTCKFPRDIFTCRHPSPTARCIALPDAHAYEEPKPKLYNHAVLKYRSSDICTDKSASQRLYQSAHARQCRH